MDAAEQDLREMGLLNFLFSVKQEQIDPRIVYQKLCEHKTLEQAIRLAREQQKRELEKLGESSPIPASPPRTFVRNCDIPEPEIIFKYVPSPQLPTPTTTPEPMMCDSYDDQPIDYSTSSKVKEDFQVEDRSQFIKLNAPEPEVMEAPPTPPSQCSDSEQEVPIAFNSTQLPKLVPSVLTDIWEGSSIFSNMPEPALVEYERMLKEGHELKCEVLRALNTEFPVSYDYNPKKSRIRTNYSDPQIAGDRTKNNIASRRSRQRKKFQTQMIQYSVDYDLDDNFLLEKQSKWLEGIISNLEQIAVANAGGIAEIKKIREQCGFI